MLTVLFTTALGFPTKKTVKAHIRMLLVGNMTETGKTGLSRYKERSPLLMVRCIPTLSFRIFSMVKVK